MDGVVDVCKPLVVHEQVRLILCGEFGANPKFVLAGPPPQIVCDTRIQHSVVAVGHYVDVKVIHADTIAYRT